MYIGISPINLCKLLANAATVLLSESCDTDAISINEMEIVCEILHLINNILKLSKGNGSNLKFCYDFLIESMKSPVSGNGNIFRSSVTVTLKWLSMQNTQSSAVKKTLRNMIAAAMVRLYTIAVTDKSLEFLDALLKIFHEAKLDAGNTRNI